MFCLNGCQFLSMSPSKCLFIKLFLCWSGWTLPVQPKAPWESWWSFKCHHYALVSKSRLLHLTILPEHHWAHNSPHPRKICTYAWTCQRSGERGSCSLKHEPLPADTLTHLPAHSLWNEGDSVSASDTEIDTGALNPFWQRQKVLKDMRECKTCSWGGKGCDRGVSRQHMTVRKQFTERALALFPACWRSPVLCYKMADRVSCVVSTI